MRFMSTARNFHRTLVLTALVLACCIYSVYYSALKNGFVNWDDDVHLLKNPFVHHLSRNSISDIFATLTNTTYIPLTELSFAVEYHFFQDQAFIYHWTNIVLHVLVSVMVMFLSLRLGIFWCGAFFAGLIFGIHPMHVESVAWVTERKDVLYSFFYMMALLGYCKYLKRLQETGKPSRYLLYGVFCSGFLSILSKPMALSLPFVLCVFDWYFKRSLNLWAVVEKLMLGVLLCPVVWMTYSQHQCFLEWRFPESIILSVWHYTIYLWKFFVVDQFFLFYKAPTSLNMANQDCLVALVVLLILVAVSFLGKWRIARFALLYYTASIFFLIPFEKVDHIGNVADRFMYLPSVGFCLGFGALCGYLWNCRLGILRFFSWIGIAALIFFLVSKTAMQIHVWESGVSLWEHQLTAKNIAIPAFAYEKLGQAYFERWGNLRQSPYEAQQALKKASMFFNKAIAVRPDYFRAYRNLGALCLETRDYTCADVHLRKAMALQNDDFESYFQLGRLLLMEGRRDQAKNAFDQAVLLSPDNQGLRERISNAMLAQFFNP